MKCVYLQSNASLVHEMQLMKAQLQELQTMMRVSFDVQLDLQRTIRQEVAAAIAAVAQGKLSTVTVSALSHCSVRGGHPVS